MWLKRTNSTCTRIFPRYLDRGLSTRKDAHSTPRFLCSSWVLCYKGDKATCHVLSLVCLRKKPISCLAITKTSGSSSWNKARCSWQHPTHLLIKFVLAPSVERSLKWEVSRIEYESSRLKTFFWRENYILLGMDPKFGPAFRARWIMRFTSFKLLILLILSPSLSGSFGYFSHFKLDQSLKFQVFLQSL